MRPIRKIMLPVGAFALAIGLSACGAAQDAANQVSDGASKVNDAASQASDVANGLQNIANNMPTNVTQVRDQLTGKLQTAPLALDMQSCSNKDTIGEAHVTNIGGNWPNGPYMTIAEQSTTKNGDYTAVDPKSYKANQIGQNLPLTAIHPSKTWRWNCGVPKDHVGWLRFSIARFDENGKLAEATKWAYLKVTA
jgi:hypothetical protein